MGVVCSLYWFFLWSYPSIVGNSIYNSRQNSSLPKMRNFGFREWVLVFCCNIKFGRCPVFADGIDSKRYCRVVNLQFYIHQVYCRANNSKPKTSTSFLSVEIAKQCWQHCRVSLKRRRNYDALPVAINNPNRI